MNKKSFNIKRKLDQRLKLFDFVSKVVKWLCLSTDKDEGPSIPLTLLTELSSRLDRILVNRGLKFTLGYVKATRNNFYNYLSGNPLRHKDSPCYGETQFPSILGPLKRYVDDEDHDVIRLIITVLTATRAVKMKGEVDTSSITQPVKGDVPDITRHMTAF